MLTDDNFEYAGLFEIFLGDNIVYCFIDNVGITFEIMFLQKISKMENFLKHIYSSSVFDAKKSKLEINLLLNKNNTKERANLILLNCLPNTSIKKDEDLFINLEKIKENIKSFSSCNSYQICIYYDNFEDFAYKKLRK